MLTSGSTSSLKKQKQLLQGEPNGIQADLEKTDCKAMEPMFTKYVKKKKAEALTLPAGSLEKTGWFCETDRHGFCMAFRPV